MLITPEYYLACYLIHEERVKDCLQETEYQHLTQIAGPQKGTTLKLYRQALHWLGRQMVQWGTELQSYTPDKMVRKHC
jgi:hypothetical protein